MKNQLITLSVLFAILALTPSVPAQSTAFTYQGRLTDNGGTTSGIYDLRFTIYDLVGGGSVISGPLTNASVAVSNGLFTTALDFGADAFAGPARWLEIGVRTNGGSGDFTTLTPRQLVTPTPYALFAGKAAMLAENVTQTFTGSIGFNPSTPGTPPFSVGSSNRVTNLNADLLDGLDSTKFLLKSEHCLNNIAELKARVAGFVPCVTVLGYYAPGDGGGGNFYWDASANVDLARFPSGEDGGTVIRPNSLLPSVPGRWRRVQGPPLNVRWFGAKGDGTNPDREAIQNAIQSSESSQSPTVWFPPGRYRLARALRAEVDNLTLLGSAGTVLVADPPDGEPFAEAILVNKGDATPLGEVRRVTIRDLTIEVKNGAGGEVTMGVIQLNNCKECAVRNVHVKYVGPTPKPKSIDGIVTSQGTSGFIQNCIVDGIPLAGIYAAQGTHDLIIESCEVKNTLGPLLQAGISVSGSDRILIKNCLSHHNGWAGLSIAVNGPIGTNSPVPAKDIQVVGGIYYSNGIGTVVAGHGIFIGSAYDGVRPEHIQLIGVTAFYNNHNGIGVDAGWDVLIASPTVADSGAHGILIGNLLISPGQPRTTRIQISNPNVYDNGRLVNVDLAGIGLHAADHVTITGGQFSTTVTGRRQKYGIGLSSSGGSNCTNIRILDPDGSVGLAQPVAAQELLSTGALDPSAAAQSGFYRIQSGGNPEGVLAAPAGSEYVDLLTGFNYRKAVGSGTNGWTVSANLSATAAWDPPAVANGAIASTTFSVSRVGIGDPVAVGFSQPMPGGALLVGSVTAPNAVTVTLLNLTGATLDLAPGTLRADARPH